MMDQYYTDWHVEANRIYLCLIVYKSWHRIQTDRSRSARQYTSISTGLMAGTVVTCREGLRDVWNCCTVFNGGFLFFERSKADSKNIIINRVCIIFDKTLIYLFRNENIYRVLINFFSFFESDQQNNVAVQVGTFSLLFSPIVLNHGYVTRYSKMHFITTWCPLVAKDEKYGSSVTILPKQIRCVCTSQNYNAIVDLRIEKRRQKLGHGKSTRASRE